MNKKNMMLSAILMILSMGLAFSNENDRIREDLNFKYENGLLNAVQLIEPGLNLSEILDRDIKILTDHRDLLQRNIFGYTGGFARSIVPLFKSLGAITFGGLSLLSGSYTFGVSALFKQLWEGEKDWNVWGANKLVDFGSKLGVVGDQDKVNYYGNKLDYLEAKHPGITAAVTAGPVMLVTSVISGMLFMKFARSLYMHNSKLDGDVKEFQAGIERDNLIIAQLKQIQYDARPMQ